ncbi:hypothetical protein E2C01_068329 [Portunus trituberculatus]|uniref:Uncharacterized protein n=1 Tax=Portunus trituberculatus TaxID=210409 RepID=A0A5B7HVX7_PORTR|nr:hypothetical protein [Portunus trituberculatus]
MEDLFYLFVPARLGRRGEARRGGTARRGEAGQGEAVPSSLKLQPNSSTISEATFITCPCEAFIPASTPTAQKYIINSERELLPYFLCAPLIYALVWPAEVDRRLLTRDLNVVMVDAC